MHPSGTEPIHGRSAHETPDHAAPDAIAASARHVPPHSERNHGAPTTHDTDHALGSNAGEHAGPVPAVLTSADDIFELAQRDDATEPDDAADAPVMALAEPDELVDVVGWTGQEDAPAPTAALSPHNTVEVHTRLPDAEEIAGAENIMTRRLPQTDAGVADSVFRAANDPDWRMPRE